MPKPSIFLRCPPKPRMGPQKVAPAPHKIAKTVADKLEARRAVLERLIEWAHRESNPGLGGLDAVG